MGELLRLMDQAKRSGVLDQLLQSMVVPETPSGSMNDATKRRKDMHEGLVGPIESHSDSDWDEVDNPARDDPTVDLPMVLMELHLVIKMAD